MANSENDLLWVYNPTKTEFTVKWGGHPYTLQSAEQKVMPRFIAEHFAKHLADAILLRREQQEHEKSGKLRPYVNHPIERPRIVNMILLGVYSQFQPEIETPGSIIANMVDKANVAVDQTKLPEAPEDNAVYEDFGLVPNKAVGNLQAPPAPTADINAPVPAMPTEAATNDGSLLPGVGATPAVAQPAATPEVPPAKPEKSKKELLEEADKLGLEVNPKMTKEQIEAMIRNF